MNKSARIRLSVMGVLFLCTLLLFAYLGYLPGTGGPEDTNNPVEYSPPLPRPGLGSSDPVKGPGTTLAGALPESVEGTKPVGLQVFEELLAQHADMTYEQLLEQAYKARAYTERLPSDPTTAAYFDRVSRGLGLTPVELALFQQNGFVAIHRPARDTFASVYFNVYTLDLPVLVTTDSLLHALHQSYDDILMEIEMTFFTSTLGHLFETAQSQLGKRTWEAEDAPNVRDVDLYLTIARNLLAGAGAPADERDEQGRLVWDGALKVGPQVVSPEEVLALLKEIQSLKFNTPGHREPPTRIYGGERYPDFSQFRARGHYVANTALRNYFRCLMWLGRVDCGWNVLPPVDRVGLRVDSDRELRDAVLFCELLRDGQGLKALKSVDDLVGFMVGRSDNLTVFALLKLMNETEANGLGATRDARTFEKLKATLGYGQAVQMIRSQLVVSDRNDPRKVPPPEVFQVFGQRFAIDSFVLSRVVFDAIKYQGRKQERTMPAGLDAMAALGNDEAIPLLEGDLRRWNYAANLMAGREFVGLQEPQFWKANLYHLWLDCLRTLHADLSAQGRFPQAMRTKAWQLKQLQAQLGSWAELRHDTVLYAKQSYTAEPSCEYPTGYVEPYPEFYGRLKFFAEEAARLFAGAEFPAVTTSPAGAKGAPMGYVEFFENMSTTMGTLETLARKELAGEPFTPSEKLFVKKVVDARGGGSGPPRYDGWYCRLFYQDRTASKWAPVITEVHTDPSSKMCLQVGTGGALLGVIAIDNDNDKMVYVGPWYSYYEFQHPIRNKRFTDSAWQDMFSPYGSPARPDWVKEFEAPRRRP